MASGSDRNDADRPESNAAVPMGPISMIDQRLRPCTGNSVLEIVSVTGTLESNLVAPSLNVSKQFVSCSATLF